MTSAIGAITKVRIPKEKWPEGSFGSATAAVNVYQVWWNVDRKNVKETYHGLKRKWDERIADDDIERSDTGSPLLWHDQTVYDTQSGSLVVLRRRHITDLGQLYLSVKDLGIDVLPLIAKDIENGNYDFLPIFLEMTPCKVDADQHIDERENSLLEWWKLHRAAWIIPDT